MLIASCFARCVHALQAMPCARRRGRCRRAAPQSHLPQQPVAAPGLKSHAAATPPHPCTAMRPAARQAAPSQVQLGGGGIVNPQPSTPHCPLRARRQPVKLACEVLDAPQHGRMHRHLSADCATPGPAHPLPCDAVACAGHDGTLALSVGAVGSSYHSSTTDRSGSGSGLEEDTISCKGAGAAAAGAWLPVYCVQHVGRAGGGMVLRREAPQRQRCERHAALDSIGAFGCCRTARAALPHSSGVGCRGAYRLTAACPAVQTTVAGGASARSGHAVQQDTTGGNPCASGNTATVGLRRFGEWRVRLVCAFGCASD